MLKIAKGHNSDKICPIVNQVVFTSLPISVPNIKALAKIAVEISG